MIWIVERASLVGSLAQDLANVPETTNLRLPAPQGDLLQESARQQEFGSTLWFPFEGKNFPAAKSQRKMASLFAMTIQHGRTSSYLPALVSGCTPLKTSQESGVAP